eukprot:scaffold302049_cov38-Prasinocladus_malaysianus.AAC.1
MARNRSVEWNEMEWSGRNGILTQEGYKKGHLVDNMQEQKSTSWSSLVRLLQLKLSSCTVVMRLGLIKAAL